MKDVNPFYECWFMLHKSWNRVTYILHSLSNTIKNPKTELYVQLFMNLYDVFLIVTL